MKVNFIPSTIRAVVQRYPALIPHLKGRARWIARIEPYSVLSKWLANDWHEHFDDDTYPNWKGEPLAIYYAYKTYDYYLQNLERLIRSVYENNLGGDFIDVLANLISGQLTQAFEQAWADEEMDGELPGYLTGPLQEMILGQYDYVDQLYRDIVDARVDETPLEPLLARAPLWAARWTEAYNQAIHLITMAYGGNEVWELGATEEHCETCYALNGIVARANEWDELGVHPQSAPNALLACGGWRCDCQRVPTDKRRSPRAYESIMNAVQKG